MQAKKQHLLDERQKRKRIYYYYPDTIHSSSNPEEYGRKEDKTQIRLSILRSWYTLGDEEIIKLRQITETSSMMNERQDRNETLPSENLTRLFSR
jgi:hypothetical protein